MAQLAFFIGKGGVGKTTVSSACAARLAQKHPRKKTLLISTDPAPSLADIFNVTLGSKPKPVRVGRGSLEVWQLDAEERFRQFLDQYREQVLRLLESGTFFTRAEIEPLLESTIPGMAEVAALLTISDLVDKNAYDHIVVDTAPMGHTLRLFELPHHFERFLEFLDIAGSRDQLLAQRFGGSLKVSHVFLAEWQRANARVLSALQSDSAEIVLVTTPERFSLNEAVRSVKALASGPAKLTVSEIVLNKAVRAGGGCKTCVERARKTRDAGQFLGKHFSGTKVHLAPDSGFPVLGAANLGAFGAHVFDGKPLRLRSSKPKAQRLELYRREWPRLGTPLSFTLGKGGVGKTTISAALAAHERTFNRERPVTVCSADPAPSLKDVFATQVTSKPRGVRGDRLLRAMEVDSVAEFRAWAERMQESIVDAFSGESGKVHIDLSFERELFTALLNIVPPGVDELFSTFRILELLEQERGRVVIDMAPTGHALELLRMPERITEWTRLLLKTLAPHRKLPLAQDVAVELAFLGQQARKLKQMLQDGKRARGFVVMLAEPLPDSQTRRLLALLKAMRAHVDAVFVNRVQLRENEDCRRCSARSAWQMKTLSAISRRNPVVVVPEQEDEIVGVAALKQLAQVAFAVRR